MKVYQDTIWFDQVVSPPMIYSIKDLSDKTLDTLLDMYVQWDVAP